MNNKMAFFILCSVLASASYAMEDLAAVLALLPSPAHKENKPNPNCLNKQTKADDTVDECIVVLQKIKRKTRTSNAVRVIPESNVLWEVVVPREQPNPTVQNFLAQFNQ